MFKFLCVFVVLAAVGAAPLYRFKRSPSWCDDDTFSTIPDLGFQVNFENLDYTSVVDSFRNYHQAFNYATYIDDMYKIFIPLGGFTKSEIKVESAGNVVFVEAMHRSMWSYMDYYFEAFSIPGDINSQGTWQLNEGILILEFPLYNKNTSPDLESNPPISTTTEENTVTTKITDAPSVTVESSEEKTKKTITTTEIVSGITDVIETTSASTTSKQHINEVEETTSEVIPTTTSKTVEKEITLHEIIPTSTAITEVKEYSEEEEPTSTAETIADVNADENENYTTPTEIPEPAQVQTTVKSDDTDTEYYPFVNIYDDSPSEIDHKLNTNMDLDFYFTTSIPLPTELVIEEDHVHTDNPFVFSFPKIPDIRNEIDPNTQYEFLNNQDYD